MNTTELLAKVRRLEIKTKGLSKHLFSGDYHSAFKGRGMSFSEVRAYQYGDDIRNISCMSVSAGLHCGPGRREAGSAWLRRTSIRAGTVTLFVQCHRKLEGDELKHLYEGVDEIVWPVTESIECCEVGCPAGNAAGFGARSRASPL